MDAICWFSGFGGVWRRIPGLAGGFYAYEGFGEGAGEHEEGAYPEGGGDDEMDGAADPAGDLGRGL